MSEPSLLASHREVGPYLGPRHAAQRARLLVEMTKAVGEKGYVTATVADAVRAARVSRGTFCALFASEEDCFIAGYRYAVDVLIARNDAAIDAAGGDWRHQLRVGVRAYLADLAENPLFSRASFLEIAHAGAAAQRERDATLRRMAGRLRLAFELGAEEDPGREVPSDDALFILSSGIEQLVCAHTRADRWGEIPGLEDTIVASAMAAFFGNGAAATPAPADGASDAG
jgi:AcrR family transcriptional regulator